MLSVCVRCGFCWRPVPGESLAMRLNTGTKMEALLMCVCVCVCFCVAVLCGVGVCVLVCVRVLCVLWDCGSVSCVPGCVGVCVSMCMSLVGVCVALSLGVCVSLCFSISVCVSWGSVCVLSTCMCVLAFSRVSASWLSINISCITAILSLGSIVSIVFGTTQLALSRGLPWHCRSPSRAARSRCTKEGCREMNSGVVRLFSAEVSSLTFFCPTKDETKDPNNCSAAFLEEREREKFGD